VVEVQVAQLDGQAVQPELAEMKYPSEQDEQVVALVQDPQPAEQATQAALSKA